MKLTLCLPGCISKTLDLSPRKIRLTSQQLPPPLICDDFLFRFNNLLVAPSLFPFPLRMTVARRHLADIQITSPKSKMALRHPCRWVIAPVCSISSAPLLHYYVANQHGDKYLVGRST